jgi:hypothetical protein
MSFGNWLWPSRRRQHFSAAVLGGEVVEAEQRVAILDQTLQQIKVRFPNDIRAPTQACFAGNKPSLIRRTTVILPAVIIAKSLS